MQIKSMDKLSEAIHSLRPVTFRYKEELDPEGIPQFGLVAEEVARVNPDLVVTDEQGQPFSVRYEEINAMLLNEFLKAHRKLEEQACTNEQQEGTISELRSALAQQQKDFACAIAQQQKEIKALNASLQKVSSQLELMKPAPRVVANDQ